MIISTALSLNPVGIVTNCRQACIANQNGEFYPVDIPKNEERYVRIGIDLGGTKRKSLRLMMQESSGFAIVCLRRGRIISKR